MKTMTTSLSESEVDVRSTETGVELIVVPSRKWWQVWIPDEIIVPLNRGQVIMLYQSLHKHGTRAMILE
jgi:hypothetical protein